MAVVKKLKTTRWYLPDPAHPNNRKKDREVPPGTPGAISRRKEGKFYYVVWKENGKAKTHPTGLKEKEAAQTYLTEWNKAREFGQVGLVDPHKPHLDKPITDHLEEYIGAVSESSRYPGYPKTVNRELRKLFTAQSVTLLRDLTAEKVQNYMAGMTCGPVTKNRVRTYAFSFCRWLEDNDRIPKNPVKKVMTAKAKVTDTKVRRRRRALRPKHLRVLLNAVASYPLSDATKPKGGRPRADGTPARSRKPAASLAPETVRTLTELGRERRLIYRTAILTGLRRGELSRVRVHMLKLNRKVPHIDAPGHILKNNRSALIPLTPSLVTELRQWIKDADRTPEDTVFDMPDERSWSRIHERHMRHAGLPYQTENGYADYHSLRKATNTFLRRRGVEKQLRQRFLRHAAADLTTDRYDDERLREMRPVVAQLEKLDAYLNSDPKATTNAAAK